MERAELKKLVLSTGCSVELGGSVFLRDPKWGPAELAQFETTAQTPGLPCAVGHGWLCIPTGGTSGNLRFARHDEQTLSTAVHGLCQHFAVKQVNALDVLPAHHVSGLMARIRCAVTDGTHVAWSWKQMEAGEWPELPVRDDGWFLSLVPTQLQRLLENDKSVAQLRRFRAVLIGGGPLWPSLADAATKAGVPVSICYGMTETAAMIAAQRPGEFAAGDRSCGKVIPYARVEIVDESSGNLLPAGEVGLVRISGEAMFRGYWPEANDSQLLLTADLGRHDAQGRLHILGRCDAVIITGGEKVMPLEVEATLLKCGEFDDVAVIGLPDSKWGQVVVACYPPRARKLDTSKIQAALMPLVSYKHPKRFVAIPNWPRNAQGKLNRVALTAAAVAALTGLNPSEQSGR